MVVASLEDIDVDACARRDGKGLDEVSYIFTGEGAKHLALEPKLGALCRGVAYRVAAQDATETRAYLQDREMDRGSYHEQFQTLKLANGQQVEALCYVINPDNPDYFRDLTLDKKAEIIATAVGPAGSNRDYLFNTRNDLQEMLVEDSEVDRLAVKVRALLDQS